MNRVAWKLQSESVLLLAWAPAILLQIAHPLIAQGVADHSRFGTERWGRMRRFQHTLHAMLRLSFGTEDEAGAVLEKIHAIHGGVHGELRDAAGIFPVGTPYSARDPALLTWVHATLTDMNVRVYEMFVEPLREDERNDYCAEAARIERPLGIPEGRLPRSYGELQRYLRAMLDSPEITVTDTARLLARAIIHPPVPTVVRPAVWSMRLVTVGLLPASIREAYGFSWDARRQALLHLSAALSRHLLRVTPSVVRRWPAARRVA